MPAPLGPGKTGSIRCLQALRPPIWPGHCSRLAGRRAPLKPRASAACFRPPGRKHRGRSGRLRAARFRQARTARLAPAVHGPRGSGSALARQPPALLPPWVPAAMATPGRGVALLSGPQLPSLAPSSPRYVRPRLPSLFPPGPSRSVPVLTVAAGGGLRAQRAVARHAGPQVVFAHDPQRPALEGPQQQHLLPLLQHAGGVAPHRGREAAGGRRRRGRGLGPAPRAWSGSSGFCVPATGTDLARAEDLPSPAPPAPLTPLFALVASGREKIV